MSKFELEDRYVVLKNKDIAKLPTAEHSDLLTALFAAGEHMPKCQCVVVESDWPEYETVCRMIEARVIGNTEFHTDSSDHDKPTSTS